MNIEYRGQVFLFEIVGRFVFRPQILLLTMFVYLFFFYVPFININNVGRKIFKKRETFQF